MTLRDYLSRRKRPGVTAFFSGLGLFALGLILHANNDALAFIALGGFAIAFSSVAYLLLGLSCPKCKGHLGQLIMSCGWSFKISPSLKYCPYCGTEFDSNV